MKHHPYLDRAREIIDYMAVDTSIAQIDRLALLREVREIVDQHIELTEEDLAATQQEGEP